MSFVGIVLFRIISYVDIFRLLFAKFEKDNNVFFLFVGWKFTVEIWKQYNEIDQTNNTTNIRCKQIFEIKISAHFWVFFLLPLFNVFNKFES